MSIKLLAKHHLGLISLIFSSPEPKAHGWANSIPVTPESVRSLWPSVCPQFQTSSPLKPLGQLNSNDIWRLLRTRERKFVKMVLVTWARWRPCPYMDNYPSLVLIQPRKTCPYIAERLLMGRKESIQTKMPIYGKNLLKIFFYRTRRPMTLGLGM